MEATKENKPFNLRPIVLSAVALSGGIFLGYQSFKTGDWITLVCAILFALAFIATIFIKPHLKRKIALYLAIVFAFFALGHISVLLRIAHAQSQPFHNQREQFIGRVYEVNYYDSTVVLYLDDCNFASRKIKGRAVAYLPRTQLVPKTDIGTVVSFDCLIINKTKEKDCTYENLGGVYYSLQDISNMQAIDFDGGFFDVVYLRARAFLKKSLSSDSLPMGLALILGDTSYYKRNALENFRFAGIAHVFAISGLHIGIVVSLFTFIAKIFKVKRKYRPFLILIPAFLYCGLCGFRPSSLRAFIMATVTILANHIGFKRDNLSASGLAGLILMLINPFYLFDYGFRLSFIAVTSIFALSPLFLRHSKGLGPLSGAVSVSLSAQIGTLPLLTQMSGYVSIISLFSNILFVPVTVFLYLLTFVFFILGSITSCFSNFGQIIMNVPDLFLTASEQFLAKIDFSKFAIPTAFGYLAIIWHLGFMFVSDYFNLKGKQKFVIGVATVLAVFACAWLKV